MTTKLLIARIERAFGGVRREGGITLPETQIIKRGGSEADLRKARSKAEEKRWQDVADEEIEKHGNALGFLDPKGFRYYLPAYMRWSLQHLKSAKTDPLNAAIYALSPSANPRVSQSNQERWALFSPLQCHVIFKFLAFMVGQYDGPVDTYMARLALEARWKQFNQRPAKPPPPDTKQ
jgi:hypothetical protein